MIITKGVTDSKITDALVLFDSNRKPIKNATTFNTETMVVSLIGGGSATATLYYFRVDAESDIDPLQALISLENLQATIVVDSNKKSIKAMKEGDTGTDDVLAVISDLRLVLVQCTSCGTYFDACIDAFGRVWSTNKTNPTDKLNTATQIDLNSFTCDNCSSSVTLEIL